MISVKVHATAANLDLWQLSSHDQAVVMQSLSSMIKSETVVLQNHCSTKGLFIYDIHKKIVF